QGRLVLQGFLAAQSETFLMATRLSMKTNTKSQLPVETPPGVTPGPSSVKTLPKHPFLEGLSPHQLRLLTDCAMVVKFKAGELIFREGDPANRFYLITQGKIAL